MKIFLPPYNWKKHAFGSISLCMIMKNEAKRLPRCLASVQGLVDEIIIVDTGSTDNSIEIAKAHHAKVFVSPWQDDFSIPRNLSIKHATKSWILILDPDELIDRRDIQGIRKLTLSKKFPAFRLTTKNYTKAIQEPVFTPTKKEDPFSAGYPGFTPSTKTRFFKNGQGIHFKGCYHELLDYYLQEKRIPTSLAPFYIHHWVHEINQKTHKDKLRFYLRLAEKKIKQEPGNPHAWHEAGVTFAIAGYRQKALACMLKALYGGHDEKQTLTAITRINKLLNRESQSRLAFEKVVCKIFPNLTHFNPTLKSPFCLKI